MKYEWLGHKKSYPEDCVHISNEAVPYGIFFISCYFLCVRPEYSLQRPVLRHLRLMFFPYREKPLKLLNNNLNVSLTKLTPWS
jgi:hypothetical protein